jgi:hypothetical protein
LWALIFCTTPDWDWGPPCSIQGIQCSFLGGKVARAEPSWPVVGWNFGSSGSMLCLVSVTLAGWSRDQILVGRKDFLSPKDQAFSEAYPALCEWVPGALPGLTTDVHVVLVVVWSYSVLPLYAFMTVWGLSFRRGNYILCTCQISPQAHPLSCTMGAGSLSRGKRASARCSRPVRRLQFGSLCSIVGIVSIPLTVWSSV